MWRDSNSTRSRTYCKGRLYCGNEEDTCIACFLWIGYIMSSLYILVAVSPFFWVNYSPTLTIVGIVIAVIGLYNAIKCFCTGKFNEKLGILFKKYVLLSDPGIIPRINQVEVVIKKHTLPQIVIKQSENDNNVNKNEEMM